MLKKRPAWEDCASIKTFASEVEDVACNKKDVAVLRLYGGNASPIGEVVGNA